MGWKNVKEAFGIDRHLVTMSEAGVAIGTATISDLVVIDVRSGAVGRHELWPNFLEENYPSLAEASDSDRLSLIQSEDQFDSYIPVYTFENGTIIQRFCEKPGYPHVTHDGHVMYENKYSTDLDQIVAHAKRIIYLEVTCASDRIQKLEQDLLYWHERLQEATQIEKLLNQRIVE